MDHLEDDEMDRTGVHGWDLLLVDPKFRSGIVGVFIICSLKFVQSRTTKSGFDKYGRRYMVTAQSITTHQDAVSSQRKRLSRNPRSSCEFSSI